MMRYDINDRVSLTTQRYADSQCDPIWGGKHGYVVGTILERIVETGREDEYMVTWDNSDKNTYNDIDMSMIKKYNPFDDELFTL